MSESWSHVESLICPILSLLYTWYYLALRSSCFRLAQPASFGIQLFQEAARSFGTLIN